MPTLTLIIQAIEVLAPLIEETVKALSEGRAPEFASQLPDPLRSRVALNAKKALCAKS